MSYVKNAKYLLIPLFNVEISRFLPFFGFILRKVKTASNYQTVYECWLKRHCFGYPVPDLKNPDPGTSH